MGIGEQYRQTAAKVADCAQRADRNPEDIKLVAVSKTVGVDGAREAYDAGARDFGENRPDQLVEKSASLPDATWHFIGNIQSRRIRDIVSHADLIHSLDSQRHAQKIDEAARNVGKVQDVLLEVNVSGEESKSGVAPQDAKGLLDACLALPNVRVCGLMTMAPRADAEEARRDFAGLRELLNELKSGMADEDASVFCELSAGMTDDWPIAVEEGATIVRIGRAIFSTEN